jgi:hypothetical protein
MALHFRSQSILVTSLGFALSIWWLSIQNYSSMDERSYSRDECQEDLYKIHQDMAGFALKRGDVKAAAKTLSLAINYRPDIIATYNQLGACYEQLGDLNNALKTYFAGLDIEATSFYLGETKSISRWPHTAAWHGEPLSGKTILVIAPDSQSKTIQFARFLQLLRQQGARVSFQPPAELAPLFSTAHLGINVINEVNQSLPIKADFHVPLMSLPARLNIDYTSMPSTKPLMPLPKTLPADLSTALTQPAKILVGLTLASSSEHGFGAASLFTELASLRHVQLVVFDAENGPNKKIIYAGKQTKTADGLAAVIKKLDVVIGTDSLALHLAGALHIPAWLLLQQNPDPLWLAKNGATIWYPTMKIFAPQKKGDWLSVFADVQEALSSTTVKINHPA